MILSEKHQMMRKFFREFAETEFTTELLDELEATGEFNWEIFHKIAAAGLTGTKIPVKYGGQGGDALAYTLMMEELSRRSAVLAIYANTSNSLGGGPLMYCGTEEQKQKYLVPVAKGEKIIVFG
ncbi:MAG: acyl-CoA dehydrogenase family protein, partial [Oscillospiraceae bacterium]|nr:acyl-CoA dehydrogenase family protein [Oscillospiraceae bacterium]